MAFRPEPGTFYTLEDLQAAGVATRLTLRAWIRAGKLKASLIGRKYLISGHDINEFLLSGTGNKAKGGAPKKRKARR